MTMIKTFMRNKIYSFLFLIAFPIIGKTQTIVKMKSEGGLFIIPCTVNGLSLNFIFDTGASDVSMSLTEASFMLKNGYLDSTDVQGTLNYLDANGSLSEGIIINLKEIEIAGIKLFNVRASIVKNMKAPLLLGQSAISKLGSININYQSHTITIRNEKYSEPTASHETKREKVDTVLGIENSLNEKEYLEKIRSEVSADNYETAIRYCDRALQINPDNEEVLRLRGYSKAGLNDYKGAVEDYNKAIKINPSDATAYCFRGISKQMLKNFRAALDDFNASISLDPKDDFSYGSRAELKADMQNYQDAIKDYTKAIQLDSKYSDYYINRGNAKQKLKDYTSALMDYKVAIQLNSNDYVAYSNKGNAEVEMKNYTSAKHDYNKSIELNPECAACYYGRGVLKDKLKDYVGALSDYNKALAIDSSFYLASIMAVLAKQNLKAMDWINVISQSEQQWFIKTNYETKDGGVIKIWTKEKKNAKTMVILSEFDCINRKSKFLSTIVYDSKGNVLKRNSNETEWEDIAPDTIQEVLFTKVCEYFN
jgi:clan AA aspartic protease (TIGR02281 family)